ncbi:TonB-dependent receptor [Pedobacter sp. SD-b]|uniref:TonB-dependent receptor n=1 Tax=Pedobacter segetis TaxID=2793069 RepID=A0ABS1BM33_9SPHI|nr:TonB-dependent receptor [Pedobacter segetis]MBK0383954.1 TonB-dependent receptor [Pedobacter segetis]
MTKQIFKASFLLLSGLITSSALIAQTKPVEKPVPAAVKDTSKTAVSEEVEVVRSYKPVLADAVKIRKSPNLNDTRPFNPKMTYDLMDKRLELNSGIRELEAQKLIKQKQDELKNNFAKLGLGNLGTNLAQLNIATGQDEALQAGFNFNHLAMSGKLNQQKISKQTIKGYARSIGDATILEGKLSYDRTGTYFYGIDPNGSFTNPNPERQKFNYFEAKGLVMNRNDATETNNFDYAAKINASLFNNAFDAKETAFIISGGLGKDLDKFHLGANASIDITTSQDSAYSFNNNLFRLNPYIQFKTDRFRFTGGINYVNEFGANQRINIFPAASLDFMLIKNYLTIFGNLGGDVDKTLLKDLTDFNPYLNTNVNLRNTVKKIDVAGGIRGTLAPNVGYKAMVSYQTVSDLSYFVNNIDKKQKFDVAYFSGNTNIIGFDGELNINFSDDFNLDSKVQIKQYNNNTEQFAWLRPGFVLTSTASFKIIDKVKLSGDLLFQGETKAKILNPDLSVPPMPLPPIITVKTIKAFADISVGAEYQYDKQISAFFRVNNILGNEYEKLPYYPNYGINILAGLRYGF